MTTLYPYCVYCVPSPWSLLVCALLTLSLSLLLSPLFPLFLLSSISPLLSFLPPSCTPSLPSHSMPQWLGSLQIHSFNQTAIRQQQQQSTNTAADSSELELISDRINTIEHTFSWEFSTNFGSRDRDDKLGTVLDELKSEIDNLRSQFPPRTTPWQHWKSKVCTIIGTRLQDQKSTRTFGCFDDSCQWKKNVWL